MAYHERSTGKPWLAYVPTRPLSVGEAVLAYEHGGIVVFATLDEAEFAECFTFPSPDAASRFERDVGVALVPTPVSGGDVFAANSVEELVGFLEDAGDVDAALGAAIAVAFIEMEKKGFAYRRAGCEWEPTKKGLAHMHDSLDDLFA